MLPQVIDHVEQGLSRNIDFLNKENFNKLIQLFMVEVQQLEDNLLSIADQKNLTVANGVWLDYIGSIIGEPRNFRSDKEYRNALLLKISINSSDGTPNNIINLTKQFTGADNSRIIDYFPAAFVNSISIPFTTPEEYPDSTEGLNDLIDNIKPAGVNGILINNINGNRFVPAWIIGGDLQIEIPFGVEDEGGEFELELDDGDTLSVINPDYILLNEEHSVLDWIIPQAFTFNLLSGGVEYGLVTHAGDDIEVLTDQQQSVSNTAGLLAQVILN